MTRLALPLFGFTKYAPLHQYQLRRVRTPPHSSSSSQNGPSLLPVFYFQPPKPQWSYVHIYSCTATAIVLPTPPEKKQIKSLQLYKKHALPIVGVVVSFRLAPSAGSRSRRLRLLPHRPGTLGLRRLRLRSRGLGHQLPGVGQGARRDLRGDSGHG